MAPYQVSLAPQKRGGGTDKQTAKALLSLSCGLQGPAKTSIAKDSLTFPATFESAEALRSQAVWKEGKSQRTLPLLASEKRRGKQSNFNQSGAGE